MFSLSHKSFNSCGVGLLRVKHQSAFAFSLAGLGLPFPLPPAFPFAPALASAFAAAFGAALAWGAAFAFGAAFGAMAVKGKAEEDGK